MHDNSMRKQQTLASDLHSLTEHLELTNSVGSSTNAANTDILINSPAEVPTSEEATHPTDYLLHQSCLVDGDPVTRLVMLFDDEEADSEDNDYEQTFAHRNNVTLGSSENVQQVRSPRRQEAISVPYESMVEGGFHHQARTAAKDFSFAPGKRANATSAKGFRNPVSIGAAKQFDEQVQSQHYY